jgi:hypothetical protein
MGPLALLFLVAALLPGAAGQSHRATVRVVDDSPFTVVGSAFRPRERVTLTVDAKTRATRTLTTSALGRFRTTFTVTVDHCAGYAVSAVGAKGSRATLKVTGECAPPDDPMYPTDPTPKRIGADALAVRPGSAPRARLRITADDPIHVLGLHFRARETVHLTVAYASVRKERTVHTSRLGAFGTSFDATTPLDPCNDTLVVTATGSRGDAATAKVMPRACPPPA